MKNKNILVLCSLILVMLGLSSCGTAKVVTEKAATEKVAPDKAAQPTPILSQNFTSNTDGFSILFPEEPKQSSEQSGKSTFNRYQITLSTGVSYEVLVKDYGKSFSDLMAKFGNDEKNLLNEEYKQFSEGYIKYRKELFPNSEMIFEPSTITKNDKNISILNFSAHSDNIIFSGQYMIVNSKLYKIMYAANEIRFNKEDYDKFKNSFVLNEPVQVPVVKPATLSVEDYYYLVPSKYLGMSIGDSKEDRKGSMENLDLDNDYIYISSSHWDGFGELAVFRSNGGEDLIAIGNSGCGPMCNQHFYLLRYNNGEWSDVTDKMLPSIDKNVAKDLLIKKLEEKGKYDEKDFSFAPLISIPQKGTTMTYKDQYSETVIYEIKWDKDHFRLEE